MIGNINGLVNSHANIRNITQSGFQIEEDAQKWFVDKMQETNCFEVYGQCYGYRVFKSYLQEEQNTFKADAILIPTCSKITIGAIAVEIKKSGEKIGPGLSQLKDYLQCVFPVGNNIGVMPAFGFLFPCPTQHEATASWMQHQRIGNICIDTNRQLISFHIGEQELLRFDGVGRLVKCVEPRSGRKSGSR